MSSADIEAAFETSVWNASAVKAFSRTFINYPHSQLSEAELGEVMEDEEVNFFECLVTRGAELNLIQAITYRYFVRVAYYRRVDRGGDNFTTARNAMETVYDTIRQTLGNTWGSTVDYWTTSPEAAQHSIVRIGGDDCHKFEQIFVGIKTESI